jgi:hypothetical protein
VWFIGRPQVIKIKSTREFSAPPNLRSSALGNLGRISIHKNKNCKVSGGLVSYTLKMPEIRSAFLVSGA